jgi:hypothetical protein
MEAPPARPPAATASPVFRAPDDTAAEGESESVNVTDGMGVAGAAGGAGGRRASSALPPPFPELEEGEELPPPDPFPESEDDDNELPPLQRPTTQQTGVAALRAGGPAAENEWFCHQCARVIAAPNDPGNPQCGGCGGYFVETRPVAPPLGFPFAVRRRQHATHRVGRRRFEDDDDDEDFADGMGGLLRGGMGMEMRRRPLTDDERMERLLAAVSVLACTVYR